MKKVYTAALLGIILGMLSLVPAATAQAQYPAPYTVTKTVNGAFTVNARMTYQRTAQGTCQATCFISVCASATGATAPVRYYWYPDSTNTGYENPDQACASFEGVVPGSETPLVRVQDGAGRTVTVTMEPVTVVGNTFNPPLEIHSAPNVGPKSPVLIVTQLFPIQVTWKSATAQGKAFLNTTRGHNLYHILAAPKGPLQINATAGSAAASKVVNYVGPQAGSFKTRIASKRSGRGYRVSGTLRGAVGDRMYQFRGRLKVSYRLSGRTRVLTSAYPRSRARPASAEPIAQLGKVSKRIACTARLRGLLRQRAKFYVSMRSRVKAGSQTHTARTTKKRVILARCLR